ncbi:MAG: RNA-binding protein [Candidatus Abawacabacteria bacterium]|nr:RNA-binding protein [Candidatus Abawacabacteria bacterium]
MSQVSDSSSRSQGDAAAEGRKLFVGGLPYAMTADEVQTLFADAEDSNLQVTSVYLPVDKMNNNRPRGFGFVEFATKEDAQRAISKFHGFEVQGRKLTVNEARPRDAR